MCGFSTLLGDSLLPHQEGQNSWELAQGRPDTFATTALLPRVGLGLGEAQQDNLQSTTKGSEGPGVSLQILQQLDLLVVPSFPARAALGHRRALFLSDSVAAIGPQ